MNLDSSTISRIADQLTSGFQGRQDAYAIRSNQADGKGKYPYRPARSPAGCDLPLETSVVERHITRQDRIGIYLFQPGTDSVRVGAFDLDDHNGTSSWEDMLAKSDALVKELDRRGLKGVRFRSSGGNGIHVWVLFDAPVKANSLRGLMDGVLAAVDLREGADGGLAAGVCEIFPKQTKVAKGGYGNLIALPLSGKSAPLDTSGEIISAEHWVDFLQDMPVNRASSVPLVAEDEKKPVGRPPKSTTIDAHPLDACAFTQHCRDNPSNLSEPLWFGLASNCGVVDGGEELFHEISKGDSARYEVSEADLKFSRAKEAEAPHKCETLAKEGFVCPNMDTNGKCKIHGGRAPAVFAQDPKARITFIKKQKTASSEAKQEAISSVVLTDLCKKGNFYRTKGTGRMLFFMEGEKRLYDLESLDFKALCNKIYAINGSTGYWKHCTEELIAHCAREGSVTETFLFSRWQDGKLYIHGGDQDVFRLNGHDIDIVSNGTDGILFEESEVEPVSPADSYQGSPVREHLVDGLNMKEPVYKDLYTAYIYSLFFEALLPTKPILLMHGVKGSGKTSALRAMKRALFGREADVSTGFTKSEGDALSAICHNYLLIADNVDGMVKWLGNLLASIATGTQILMRTLYRTNEVSKYMPRCFPAITSRDPLSLKRDDLADRLFMIILLRRKEFIPESDLNRRIIADRNTMWRELLTNLNKIIRLINDGCLPESSSHRLADWARLVTVIGEALDLENIEAGLDLLASERKEFVLEGNAIYEGIQAWTDNDKWRDEDDNLREVTTGQLHSEIHNLYYNGHGFGVANGATHQFQRYPIESPRKFGVELNNTLTELASRFDITIREGRSRQKLVKIRPLPIEWTARAA